MLSRFFHKARNFQITGSTFNQVQGDQHNTYTTTIVQAKEEPSEFDEYFKLRLGGIFKLRDVGSTSYPRRWDDGRREWGEEGELRFDKTICTARVLEQPGMVFTMLQYSGPDAHRAFLEDFRMLSNTLTSNASQIYGYSKSSIPSLILYNDLAPASRLMEGNLDLGVMYLLSLAWQLGCKDPGELWIDNGRGIICRGPPGPGFRTGYKPVHWFGESDVPLTTDLLQSDVLLRFAASLKSWEVDRYVIRYTFPSTSADGSVRVSQPTVISKLTNTPIAVANNAWKSDDDTLSDRKVLGDGLTRRVRRQSFICLSDNLSRFTLAHNPEYLSLRCNGNADDTWKSQAWRIFHNRGITLEDDLSAYDLAYSDASLESDFVNPSEAQLKRQSQQLIYLFVRPPPSDLNVNRGYHITSSLHHWSFHEDGCPPLSPDTCRGLGLPAELFHRHSFYTYSWSNEDYQRIHQYQLPRGFDPSTTDFARHLGYDDNLFQPVDDSDRFQIYRESPPESRSSTPTSDISGETEYWTSSSDISEESEDSALIEPILASTTSGTRLGHTGFWSPAFRPSPAEVSSELATMTEALDLDVD
ncbi:hypothetical protein PQX77_007654 [Marasmius sp. AFHP31]|nr:hypothetical protein PQX77_007654 [Marasmius sp. AFHP31]